MYLQAIIFKLIILFFLKSIFLYLTENFSATNSEDESCANVYLKSKVTRKCVYNGNNIGVFRAF